MTRRRKVVDASQVFEAVESGRLSKDVMAGFGLAKPTVQPKKRGPRPKKTELSAQPEPEVDIILGHVTISKRGSLALPREMVEDMGFRIDDIFAVRKTRAGMILKPRQK